MKERTARPQPPVSNIAAISHAAGRITTKFGTGNFKNLLLADVLRESDIPQLTADTVPDLTVLAKLIMALLRTLVEHGLLDDGVLSEDYGDVADLEDELVALGTDEL